MIRGVCALALVLVAIGGAWCSAQDLAEQWLRAKVFVKPGATPKVGSKRFRWNDVPIPGQVTKIDGNWLWIGTAWARPDDLVRAADAPGYFTDLMRRRPGEAGLWYQLRGVAWILKHEYDNAVKDFTVALRSMPDSAQLYHARGQAYHFQGKYDQALADFNQTIRLDPTLAVAYSDRGAAYKDLGDYGRAHEAFSEAIRLDPKSALYWQNRGVNWYQRERYEEALADLDEAVRLDPKLVSARCNRGFAWFKRGDYDKALENFNQALELDDQDPLGHYELARFYATCPFEDYRDGARAVTEATLACDLDRWETWNYVAALAAAYAESGEFDKAVDYQRQAMALDHRPESRDRKEMEARLEKYMAREPWREESTTR